MLEGECVSLSGKIHGAARMSTCIYFTSRLNFSL